MKPAVKIILTTALLFFTCVITSYSQRRSTITGSKFRIGNNSKKRKPLNYLNSIQLLGSLSAPSYGGDLCDGFGCAKPRPSFGIGLQYRFSESISFRAEGSYYRLVGSDLKDGTYFWRGLSFFSNTFDFSGTVVYDIFEYNKMYRRRSLISPYLTLGVGVISVNPKAEYNGEVYKLRPLMTEDVKYKGAALVVPYGFGGRVKLTPSLNLAVESVWRWTSSDYIDDVSDKYSSDVASLPSTDIRRALADRRAEAGANSFQKTVTIRGNPKTRDSIYLFTVKLEYTLRVTKQRYNINSNTSRFRIIKSIKKR